MNNSKRAWLHLILVPSALVFSLPIIVMVLSSFKSPEQLARNPYDLFPDTWHFENYSGAVSEMPFGMYLANSLVLCAGCTIGATLSCALVAYSLTCVRWRGKKWLMITVIAAMLLPWHVTMIPRFLLVKELGFYDSFAAIILPSFLGEAFFIFLLRQFFVSIPNELLEAGRLDGLGHWGLFRSVVMPLSIPALATVALFQFVETWNDFAGPLLYLNDPDKFPLAYGLERFVSSYSDQTHLLLAAAVLFTLPMIVLFFLAQKTFIQGIRTSGIKE